MRVIGPGTTAFLVASCLAIFARTASPLDPEKRISQYTRTVWTASDGLPQNTVQAVLQTRDGYVWLATEEGLVRFDGVKFDVFDQNTTPELPGKDMKSLFEAPDGSLWIGMVGGVARLLDGRFTGYPLSHDLTQDWITALTVDRAGNVWLGALGGGLLRLENGRATAFTSRNGLADNFVWAVRETRDGSLWIGTQGGLTRKTGDRFVTYTTRDGLPDDHVNALWEDREGTLWIGTTKGLVRSRGGKFEIYTTRDGLSNDDVSAFHEDAEGSLWIGTSGGVSRRNGHRFDRFGTRDGLSHDSVASLAGDREGNLWIGTHGGGVTKLTDRSFSTLSVEEGLSSGVVRSLLEGRDGTLWIGTQGGGLNRVKDGQVLSPFTMGDGLPGDTVTALLERADGSVWIGTAAGLARLQGGRISVILAKHVGSDSIRALFEDRDGALWIGTRGAGLKILRDGQLTAWGAGTGFSDVVRSFYQDRDGAVWVGTDAGLSRYADGRFEHFGAAQGVFRKGVMTIGGDPDGTIWAGTYGDGLYRYKDGKFTHYSTANGLFDDNVFQIVDDGHGSLWMTCNRGVFRVGKQMLVDLAEGRARAITSTAFGAEDGMRAAECNGNGQPAGIRTKDGALWFPTIMGAVSVRPDKLVVNTLPPPVVIERLVVDRRPVTLSGDIRIPPGDGELEFHYTALSFVAPGGVRFKYRLTGFDREWVDAGTRRQARYTNIPPGSYRFQVLAQNDDGVWNEQGAVVGIDLTPHFYQRTAFHVACLVALALALGGLFRLRVRRIRQQAAALEQIVDERTRALREEVSERRRAEDGLRRARDEAELANRAKGQFLANMSHEIRTPMNGIIGMTNLALDTTLTVEQREYLDMVQQSADALLSIIEDILDFSKIEAGRLELDLAPFELRAALQEMLNPLLLRARAKGLELDARGRPAGAGCAGRRPGPAPPGPDQPDRQRDQVHAPRRREGRGRGGGGAGGRADHAALRDRRYRHRHRGREARDHLRALPSGGRLHDPRVRGNRPGPRHMPNPRRRVRRPHLGREQPFRQYLPLHGPARPGSALRGAGARRAFPGTRAGRRPRGAARRGQPGQPDPRPAAARAEGPPRRGRRDGPRGGGGARTAEVRRHPDGRADAGDERLRSDRDHPRRGNRIRRSHAHRGDDRPRDEGRPRAVPGRGNGRLRLEADQSCLPERRDRTRAGPEATARAGLTFSVPRSSSPGRRPG